MSNFIAVDLGAESGRVVYATIEHAKIALEEAHRFPTTSHRVLGTRHWNYMLIHQELVNGLAICAKRFGGKVSGIGIDTWGVDFGLIGRDGGVLGNPVQYRDSRTDGMMDAAFRKVKREEIYSQTGIQFMQINTIYQLLSLVKTMSPQLSATKTLLLMPDLFAYLLCGKMANELTIASTSQLLDPRRKKWSGTLLKRLNIPAKIFLKPTFPGTPLGPILPEIAEQTGLKPDTPVISTCGHDTACAVVAVPSAAGLANRAYLSCGTWSLLGAELDEPNTSAAALAADFTNELGYGGTVRFLKNISGLWLLQECRRNWSVEGGTELDYATLAAEAEDARSLGAAFDVNDPRLLAPPSMVAAIEKILREKKQPLPESRGEMARLILENLAAEYARTIAQLDEVLGRKTPALYMIGGGIQNELLCQLTANACKIPVHAGPVEATAIGNVCVQALATGDFSTLGDARKAVSRSFGVKTYHGS